MKHGKTKDAAEDVKAEWNKKQINFSHINIFKKNGVFYKRLRFYYVINTNIATFVN